MESRLWPLRQILHGVSHVWNKTPLSLLRRDVAPAECFDVCDGAYRIALSVGKTDKLCAPGGSFMAAYQLCASCIADGSRDSRQSLRDYLNPKFGQFISYCEGKDTAGAMPDGGETAACDGCITTALEDYRGSTIMIVLGTKTVPTSSLLDREFFKNTTVTETVTYRETGLPSSTTTSEADGNEPDSPSGPDLATIVGPVVPSVILLMVLVFIGFRWHKKRERIKDQEAQMGVNEEEAKVEKAQLHSNCIPRPTYELEGSTPMIPDPGSEDGAEMAANEVAAHEMPTDKKPGDRGATEESNSREAKMEVFKSEESKLDERKSGNGDDDAAGASNK